MTDGTTNGDNAAPVFSVRRRPDPVTDDLPTRQVCPECGLLHTEDEMCLKGSSALDPAALIACPSCDLLHNANAAIIGESTRCARCGTVLSSSRPRAIDRTLAAAATNVILIIGALFFPFIQLDGAGAHQSATLIDAVTAFGGGLTAPLVLVVAAFIVVLPFMRAAALCYTLWPLRFGRAPYRGATRAFRFANALKPWSMAEIFIIGVVVALVKIAGMAEVSLGPAFWMLTAMVVVLLLENHNFCRWTIWRILGTYTRA